MLESTLGVSTAELGLIWLVTAGAAILRSFTGFGFALAAVPVYAFFLQPAEAVVLCASLALGIGLQTLPQYVKDLGVRQQWPVFLLALPGTLLGATLLRQLDADQFRLAIGVVTIAASIALARLRPRARRRGRGLRPAVGLLSGLLNGAFAVPGPPIIIYSMSTEADPARSRAFMIGFFSFSSLLALGSFGLIGLLSVELAMLALAAYPAMWLGDKVGYRLFRTHAGARYRQVAVATCLAIGVSICLRALF